jgi:Cysteine-rich secretory protein family/Domain of unknown function (DUF4214)
VRWAADALIVTQRLRTAFALVAGIALLVVGAVAGPLPTASASPYLLSALNAERAAAGAGPLARAADMDAVAQRWSEQMAATGKLQHNPNYFNQVTNWRAIGENVGVAATEARVHTLLMNSPGHRENILDRRFTEVGLGVASSGGRVWVTQVFRQPMVPTAAPVQTMSSGDASAYVSKVYSDLLGRRPDPAGQQQWTNQLMYGAARDAVANSITSSAEFRSRLISNSYADFLGRGADPAGLQHWLTLMANGWTIQQMESGFISSAEFYAQAGGNDAGWVRKLYREVLGREASSAEVASWTAAVQRGATRSQVAMGFLLSTEDLSSTVDGYYRWLLRRGLDPVGQSAWVQAIQRGTRVEQIIGGIIASPEYFARR